MSDLEYVEFLYSSHIHKTKFALQCDVQCDVQICNVMYMSVCMNPLIRVCVVCEDSQLHTAGSGVLMMRRLLLTDSTLISVLVAKPVQEEAEKEKSMIMSELYIQ